MDYKYSIVMPAYNIEKYIAEMIESIIDQTYSNWELIIIDDGSEDRTGEICDKYASDKVSVYHIENKGQIGARIEGIHKCTGDYVLVVDSDDFLVSSCLQKINDILNQKRYDCVVFPFDCCDEQLNYVYTTTAPSHTGELTQEELIKWIIDTMNHGLVNKAIKNDLIKKGISDAMTEKVSINGDFALIIPIMCYVKSAYYIDAPYYRYRMFEKSISHNRIYKHVTDTDHVIKSVVSVLRRHCLFYGEIEQTIMKSYLSMIIWLISEVNHIRFIKKHEINELHNSQFFKDSKKYESRKSVGITGLVKLNLIRREGYVALLLMNILFRMDTFLRVISRTAAKEFYLCSLPII